MSLGIVRVSPKSQETNFSLKCQNEQLLKHGVQGSGSDSIQDRPALWQLVEEDLKANDLLLLTKIDTWSRNSLDFLKLQEKLSHKVILVLVKFFQSTIHLSFEL